MRKKHLTGIGLRRFKIVKLQAFYLTPYTAEVEYFAEDSSRPENNEAL